MSSTAATNQVSIMIEGKSMALINHSRNFCCRMTFF